MATKNIIVKPIITEKVSDQTERLNKYGFVVDNRATKDEIREAVESTYGVKVEGINTMVYGGGKPKMKYTTKGVSYQRTKMFKKAIITVADGDVIDLYSSI